MFWVANNAQGPSDGLTAISITQMNYTDLESITVQVYTSHSFHEEYPLTTLEYNIRVACVVQTDTNSLGISWMDILP